jgi:hypothetical protein
MNGSGAGFLGARARPGLRAGGTVGLLTGLCYLLLFGGLDFSGGNPIQPLLALSLRSLAMCVGLVAAGAFVGAIVSIRTPDE